MGELTEEQFAIIIEVMDDIAEEYGVNNKIIFRTDSERAGGQYGDINARLKDWKKGRICMVPGCGERAIKRSHTVPRELSLASIAEGGHHLTPDFDHVNGKIKLAGVGVNQASTFPGFCTKHEGLFQGFETSGRIEHEGHVYLQAYRAVCREHFRAALVIEQHDRMMAKYLKFRDERLAALAQDRLREMGLSGLDVKSFRLEDDPHFAEWQHVIESARSHSVEMERRILPAFEKAIFCSDKGDVYIYAFSIDVQVPVALSGAGYFYVEDNGSEKSVGLLISTLPTSGGSLLIIAGHILEQRYIEAYVAKWMTNAFSMLAMVESWMVNGTDQWYIKPSVWEALPEARKTAILSALQACEQNIGEEFELSIFDELRRHMLALLDAQEKERGTEYYEFVAAQIGKMK